MLGCTFDLILCFKEEHSIRMIIQGMKYEIPKKVQILICFFLNLLQDEILGCFVGVGDRRSDFRGGGNHRDMEGLYKRDFK